MLNHSSIVAIARLRGLSTRLPRFPGFRAVALHPGLFALARLRGLKTETHMGDANMGKDRKIAAVSRRVSNA